MKTKYNKVHHQLTLAARNSLKVHQHSWPYIVAHFYTNYVIHSMFFAFNLNFHIFCSVDFYILIRFQRHNERYNTEKSIHLLYIFFCIQSTGRICRYPHRWIRKEDSNNIRQIQYLQILTNNNIQYAYKQFRWNFVRL